MQGHDINLAAKDRTDISMRTYSFGDKPVKGVLIVCHGFGEHSGSYEEFALHLGHEGFACIAFSQRGHGKLPKKMSGVILGYQSFMDDIETVVDYINIEMPSASIALFGHSMGGNIAINYLLRRSQSTFSCAILESPWLGLLKEIRPHETRVIKAISGVSPNAEIPKSITKLPLPTEKITGDKEKQQVIKNDPLYHNRMTWRLSAGMNDGCAHALFNASKLSVPTLLAVADNEEIVSNEAIEKFYKACSGNVVKKEYQSKHSIHNDLNRKRFYKDMTDFLNHHCPAQTSALIR